MEKNIIDKFENYSAKGNEKVAKICREAAQVFAKNSYLGTTLSEIAQAAGISKAGIFHYFKRKEEILFWIIYQFRDKNFQALKSKIDKCDSDQDKLYICIKDSIDQISDNQDEFRVSLVELKHLSIEYQDIIKKKQREYTLNFKSLIEKLIDKRSKDFDNLTLITFCLLGMCSWPYTWFKSIGKFESEDLSRIIYRIFMGDLKIN